MWPNCILFWGALASDQTCKRQNCTLLTAKLACDQTALCLYPHLQVTKLHSAYSQTCKRPNCTLPISILASDHIALYPWLQVTRLHSAYSKWPNCMLLKTKICERQSSLLPQPNYRAYTCKMAKLFFTYGHNWRTTTLSAYSNTCKTAQLLSAYSCTCKTAKPFSLLTSTLARQPNCSLPTDVLARQPSCFLCLHPHLQDSKTTHC